VKCPLCQEELLEIGSSDWKEYFCRVRIKFEGKASLPHYEHRENESAIWYLPPYKITVKDGKTTVSTLEENTSASRAGRFTKPSFKTVFIMDEVFQPTDAEKLTKRIKLLTIFS
jgi:hypothetical protein